MEEPAPDVHESHRTFYTGAKSAEDVDRIVTPGNQHLVQLLRGGFLGDDLRTGRGRRALDVGCGSGFNCVSLAMIGFDTHGVEIDSGIVDHARANVAAFGVAADIAVGSSQSLPHADASIDLLVSMNVIHYASSRAMIDRAVVEYLRVLAPGGTLYLTTNHPRNWILEGAAHVGNDVWRVQRPGDYRDGLDLYVFPDRVTLVATFGGGLTDVRTGENRYDFFDRVVRNLTLTGRRTGS